MRCVTGCLKWAWMTLRRKNPSKIAHLLMTSSVAEKHQPSVKSTDFHKLPADLIPQAIANML